ncbi:MAG: hypothetical protein K4H23_04410 [Mollicutes bacterium PWAP]|nr:hypothetical protein [Mollicutes bacterium PWAP]
MNNIISWIGNWPGGGFLTIFVFVFISFLIVFSSLKLVKYSGVLMSKTKFGNAFIGGTLIAVFTSVPELITEIAQGINGTPGTGIADDLGANAFSALSIAFALIIFISNMFMKKISFYTKISLFLNGGLMIIISLLMFLGKDLSLGKSGVFIIGIIPIIMAVVYIISLIFQWKFQKNEEEIERSPIKNISKNKGILLFFTFGGIVTILALLMNWTVDGASKTFNISPEGPGGLVLSVTTSLPEITAFFALIKSKQYAAGVAAILGAQMFNLGIAIFGDMAFTEGSMFSDENVSAMWPISAIAGTEMIILGISGVTSKYIKNKWIYSILPVLAIFVYIIGWILFFSLNIFP